MPFIRKTAGQILVLRSRRVRGNVEQEVLHAFGSPAELAKTLEGGRWVEWTSDLEWRHPDIRWDWPRLREDLERKLVSWQGSPSGAALQRARKIAHAAFQLAESLSTLSPAHPRDALIIATSSDTLAILRHHIERLLGPPAGSQKKGFAMQSNVADLAREAEALFDEGMEHWWRGDRATAARYYRKALELVPDHSDAHVHLGLAAFERGRLKEAEEHYELAIGGGVKQLTQEDGKAEWGHLENRPYLRALYNVALVYRRRKLYNKALAIHERMIAMNPDDNQGVRFLLGEEIHRSGDLPRAIAAYESAQDEPGCCFGLALALYQSGRPPVDVGLALLRGFAANRYLAPMLLGQPWQMLDGFHGTNMAEPEWAAEHVSAVRDLWATVPASAAMLRRWWEAAPVRFWRGELDGLIVKLGKVPVGPERSALVGRKFELISAETLARLAEGAATTTELH